MNFIGTFDYGDDLQPLRHCLNVLTESVQKSETNNIFFYVLVLYRAQKRLAMMSCTDM